MGWIQDFLKDVEACCSSDHVGSPQGWWETPGSEVAGAWGREVGWDSPLSDTDDADLKVGDERCSCLAIAMGSRKCFAGCQVQTGTVVVLHKFLLLAPSPGQQGTPMVGEDRMGREQVLEQGTYMLLLLLSPSPAKPGTLCSHSPWLFQGRGDSHIPLHLDQLG